MSIGVENGERIGVIENESIDRPSDQLLFSFTGLSDGRFSVYHPFHGPFTIGDRSTFPDQVTDTTAALLLSELPYLADSRKLNRTRRFETRPYASEYSQLSHCVSLGVIAVEFGGGVLDTIDGLMNDTPHAYDGHQADDNYQGHGKETFHDLVRPRFLKRAGFMGRMVDEGVLRPNAAGFHVGKTRLYLSSILDEDEVTVRRSFLSNKHESRRMDGDRFQYNEEERLLSGWAQHLSNKDPSVVPLALTQTALQDVSRTIVLDNNEGEQLVYGDPNIAFASSQSYVEQNVEHWCEPVQDLVNDLLNLAERYFFTCDHPVAREMQYFYPRDYLHTSADLMMRRFDAVAKDDTVMAWLLNTAEAIAGDQRAKNLKIILGKATYDGPNPMDGVTLEFNPEPPKNPEVSVNDKGFTIDLPKGKVRSINPRVCVGNRLVPLTECDRVGTIYQDFIREKSQWIGDYVATIVIEDKALKDEVDDAMSKLEEEWPFALTRVPMPDTNLRDVIKEANEYVLQPKRRASFA